MANGVCLMQGCELSVRRWVRNPVDTRRRHMPIMNQRAWSTLWLAKIMLETGRFPTFDEVRQVVGLRSRAGAVRIVNSLIKANLLERPAAKDSLPVLTEAGHRALLDYERSP